MRTTAAEFQTLLGNSDTDELADTLSFTADEMAAAAADVAALDAEFPEPAATRVPKPRRTPDRRHLAIKGAAHCADCGKRLKWASPDGLGPVCRAKRRAPANPPEELL